MLSPISIATGGYINLSPLSIYSDGYLTIPRIPQTSAGSGISRPSRRVSEPDKLTKGMKTLLILMMSEL